MRWSWNEFFFFQAEDGIRDLVRSRGLGDVYKRQGAGVPVGRDHALRQEHVAAQARHHVGPDEGRKDLSLIHI